MRTEPNFYHFACAKFCNLIFRKAGIPVRCPACGNVKDKVVDSREKHAGEIIRRRRECLECSRRFTTYERIEHVLPQVIKKDGHREEFDRNKLLLGIKKACEKRPIALGKIEEAVGCIEKAVYDYGDMEVPSSFIGEQIMSQLHELDTVAYVRFASVYREFKDVAEFMEEIKSLLSKGES